MEYQFDCDRLTDSSMGLGLGAGDWELESSGARSWELESLREQWEEQDVRYRNQTPPYPQPLPWYYLGRRKSRFARRRLDGLSVWLVWLA